jgi:hypothetical protein
LTISIPYLIVEATDFDSKQPIYRTYSTPRLQSSFAFVVTLAPVPTKMANRKLAKPRTWQYGIYTVHSEGLRAFSTPQFAKIVPIVTGFTEVIKMAFSRSPRHSLAIIVGMTVWSLLDFLYLKQKALFINAVCPSSILILIRSEKRLSRIARTSREFYSSRGHFASSSITSYERRVNLSCKSPILLVNTEPLQQS